MDNEEIKRALFSEDPVIISHHYIGEIEGRCVKGVIYRNVKGKLSINAEVLLPNGRSVVVAPIEDVRLKEKEPTQSLPA